jgi:hypothetical protein
MTPRTSFVLACVEKNKKSFCRLLLSENMRVKNWEKYTGFQQYRSLNVLGSVWDIINLSGFTAIRGR